MYRGMSTEEDQVSFKSHLSSPVLIWVLFWDGGVGAWTAAKI